MAGVKIIDLSAVVSGPMATGILADQGAEVIKVETDQGDLTRVIGPVRGDVTPLYASINRGKRGIVLDLKQPAGCAVLRSLLADADVLVENFRPGALARLGFGYEAVQALNPRIVYVSISGFGQTGPNSQVRVYDPVIQAASGMADSHPDPATGEPRQLQTLMCDKITALTAAQAITAALFAVRGGAPGQRIELSMLDAALAFLWPEAGYNHAFLDDPLPALVPEYGTGQRLWRCSDGYMAIITPQDAEFAAMCRTMGRPELPADPRFLTIQLRRANVAMLRAELDAVVALRPVDDWVRELAAANVPVGRVNTKATVADDAQVRHNGTFIETNYAGWGRVRSARAAAVFNGTAMPQPDATAPHRGEHSREILQGLGRDAAAIDALFASGAVK
jgi:crotonobetainyl-CoA:carnitine CoA-transferase CaiB-like acyl-CoA transferase